MNIINGSTRSFSSPSSNPVANQQTANASVLVIEDEPTLRNTIAGHLKSLGFTVHTAADSAAALNLARQHECNSFVLDVRLGRDDGFALAHELQQLSTAPILFISGVSTAELRAHAFEQGFASDFIAKPFAMSEFTARLRAMLRRQRRELGANAPGMVAGSAVIYQIDDISLDTADMTLRREGAPPQAISQALYRLLMAIINAPSQTISKSRLMAQMAGDKQPVTENAIKVMITRLRHLLSQLGVPHPIIVHDRQRGGYFIDAQVRTKTHQ